MIPAMTHSASPARRPRTTTRLLIHALLWAGACQFAVAAAPGATAATQNRCGWFDNPTPGNATLVDKDGEWTVGVQGGHQAEGKWPAFSKARWVQTGNGSAGYGCACLKMSARPGTQEVANIASARSQPLATCRNDKALAGKEPENPLQ
jgi:hypothetical protein